MIHENIQAGKRILKLSFFAVLRFRVTKCEKPARERRTLLITDSNGSLPSTPTEVEPRDRTASESQQVCGLKISAVCVFHLYRTPSRANLTKFFVCLNLTNQTVDEN